MSSERELEIKLTTILGSETPEFKKIDSLTEEQKALVPIYKERYKALALSTEPTDKALAEEAIKNLYKYIGLNEPTIEWVLNPIEGARRAAQEYNGRMDVTVQEIREQASMASYGSFEACYIAFYTFIAENFPVPHEPLVKIANDLVKHCGVYWTFEDYVIVCGKPIAIHMVGDKLHNPDGYAIEYPGDWGVCALNGEVVKNLSTLLLKGMIS
jgi:hypothetical protein